MFSALAATGMSRTESTEIVVRIRCRKYYVTSSYVIKCGSSSCYVATGMSRTESTKMIKYIIFVDATKYIILVQKVEDIN